MMLIPAPQDITTGEPNQFAIATVNIEKLTDNFQSIEGQELMKMPKENIDTGMFAPLCQNYAVRF